MKLNRQLIKRRGKQFRWLIPLMVMFGFNGDLTRAVLKKRLKLMRNQKNRSAKNEG